MNPLEMLVTALAYLMKGDGEVSAEERAKLLAILNKHVGMKHLQPGHLKQMVAAAFTHARMVPVETFAAQASPDLSPGQKMSIYANLYDVSLADGELRGGENRVLDIFRGTFELDANMVSAMKEILLLKNDTTVFTSQSHPHNDPAFKLRVQYQRE